MGVGLSRIGDIGIGTCYHPDHETPINTTGIILNGSGNVTCNSQGVSRVGDIILSSCGHVGIIISGSSTVLTNNMNTARVSSMFTGHFEGIIITGSGNTLTG